MPGIDLTQLSSNWRILQQKLQREEKRDPRVNGLKRKRTESELESNTTKSRKKIGGLLRRPYRSSKMGANSSKDEADLSIQSTTNSRTSSDNLSTTALTQQALHVDEVNGGLHTNHKIGKYLSLDCEMVGTGPPPHSDNVLARVSIVNYHGQQVYDSYVQPPNGLEIEDYRTFVSGIRAEDLRPGYARTFDEVQNSVIELLKGRVLVGHALRNDLNVLQLQHPKKDMRDTSHYPKYRVASAGKTPALRNLALAELGTRIQVGEHSSVEDARVTMELFRKEKVGFEEENVRVFGRGRTVVGGGQPQKDGRVHAELDLEEESEVDEEADDDEGDGMDRSELAQGLTPPLKKRRRGKKRTKRK